jgi:hypothetical protein
MLARKDMDVNEHERLSNNTLKTQTKVKEQLLLMCLYYVSKCSAVMAIRKSNRRLLEYTKNCPNRVHLVDNKNVSNLE